MSHYRKKIFGVVCVVAALSLAGCGTAPSQPPTQPKEPQQLTVAQKRQHYLHRLQKAHVQAIKVGETYQFIIPSSRLFIGGDSTNLNSDYDFALNTLAKLIKTYQTVAINISAFTSKQFLPKGPLSQTKAITVRQAEAVAAYLWSRGIDTRLLATQGHGDQDAVASNVTPQGRQANQRVVISFRFYPKAISYD